MSGLRAALQLLTSLREIVYNQLVVYNKMVTSIQSSESLENLNEKSKNIKAQSMSPRYKKVPAKKLGNNKSPLRLNPIVRTSRNNLHNKLQAKLPLTVHSRKKLPGFATSVQYESADQVDAISGEIREKEGKLASLKADIRSRQRLLNNLTEKVSDPQQKYKIRQLEEEIFLRDKHIESINERLIAAAANVKENSQAIIRKKERILDEIDRENEQLISERDLVDQKTRKLEGEMEELKQKLEESKRATDNINQKYELEIDNMRSEISMDEDRIAQALSEIERLAGVIGELKVTNQELVGKFNKTNEQIDRYNAEIAENQRKAVNVSHVEGQIADQTQINQGLEQKLQEIQQESAQLVQAQNALEQEIQEQSIHMIESALQITTETQRIKNNAPNFQRNEELHKTYDQIIAYTEGTVKQLNDSRARMQNSGTTNYRNQENEQQLRQTANHMNDLKKQNTQIQDQTSRSIKEYEFLRNKATEISEAVDKIKQEGEQGRSGIYQHMNAVINQFNELTKEKAKVSRQLTEKEQALNKIKQSTMSLAQENEKLRRQIEKQDQRAIELEEKIREIRKQQYALKSERRKYMLQAIQREQKMKLTGIKLAATEKELQYKDEEINKRDEYLSQLNKQVEECKTQIAESTVKIRTLVNDEIKQATRLLDAKENEIRFLKDIIKQNARKLQGKETPQIRPTQSVMRNPRLSSETVMQEHEDRPKVTDNMYKRINNAKDEIANRRSGQ